MTAATTVFVALGANLGDRAGAFDRALARMRARGIAVEAVSPYRRTRPLGGLDQPPYLNAVARARTALTPQATLAALLSIEAELGRVREPGRRWAPRRIDLDLLDHGGRVLRQEGLELPHPRLGQRRFVLDGLRSVAPSWRHPLTADTLNELLARLEEDPCRS